MTRPARSKTLLAAALALLAISFAPPDEALARDRSGSRHSEAGAGLSLDDAVRQVQAETGGRILSADSVDGSYRIKVLLPSGHVRVIVVDARSGARR